MYSIKNRGDLERFDKLPIKQNQVQEMSLQDKLGKHTFHEVLKKVLEPVTKKLKMSLKM